MKKIKEDFTKHPESIGETYLEHLWCCIRTSASLACVVFVLLIHGLFPFLFEKTGSALICELNEKIQRRVSCGQEASEHSDTNQGE